MAESPIIQYVDNYKGITQDTVKRYLSYEPEAGIFKWRVVPGEVRKPTKRIPGKIAGYVSKTTGYVEIKLQGHKLGAHQIAFLYMEGRVPATGFEIDHRDTIRSNNAWLNLRPATLSQNRANARIKNTNTTGVKGVWKQTFYSTYCASVYRQGLKYYLGSFRTSDEAHAAYVAKARELDGDFFRETLIRRPLL